jgi:branched-chain amino acid transport system substrate-binding protein
MNQKKVPQLFVATGATKWGDPKNFPWTMGWQPNYQTESKIYARTSWRPSPTPRSPSSTRTTTTARTT